jgi:uncharacterized protein YegL
MPKFDNMQTINVPGGGNFQFSAIRPEELGATEYTLVTIVVDITASVASFSEELLKTLKSVISACQHSPRTENLMVRLLLFNEKRHEVHGFIPLSQIDVNAYKALKCSGATALYDAVYDAVSATNMYAQTLFTQDFDVNAAIYIITDGMDNCSKIRAKEVADQVQRAMRQEYLDSLITVLIGVVSQYANHLQVFKEEAKLTQFVNIADANPDTLGKLGSFVSKSISMQSQALGTGTPSQHLTF